jgi:TRAP-type C4-dicarboxylate transport system permease small subunit
MAVRGFILQISSVLNQLCERGSVGFFAAMLILVLVQVVARYILRAVPVWTEEAARYCMVWGGMLGATIAFYRDEDPKLLQPPKKGPRLWLGFASILRALTVVLFLGPVLYYSDRFLLRHWQRTADALSISTFWVTIAVPIAVAVIFIHLIARIGRGDDHKLGRGSDPN